MIDDQINSTPKRRYVREKFFRGLINKATNDKTCSIMDLKTFMHIKLYVDWNLFMIYFFLLVFIIKKCYIMIVIYILIDKNISMTQLLFLFS